MYILNPMIFLKNILPFLKLVHSLEQLSSRLQQLNRGIPIQYHMTILVLPMNRPLIVFLFDGCFLKASVHRN